MPRAKQALLSANEMLEVLNTGIKNQAVRPNLYGYKPHAKQYMFHTAPEHTRLYIGGNRSGKTVGGGVETCYWLMKKHPYRALPLPEGPVRGRGVAVDFTYGVDVLMIPEILRWLPPSYLINGSFEDSYSREHRTLTLTNKSTMEFRSYEQDLDKFAGASRHFTWFDEEPPKHIYNECMARLVDTDGYTWLTMTPVEGMSWVFDDIYKPGTEGHPDIAVIEIEMTENPHLSQVSINRFLDTLDPDEKKARSRGEFMAIGGKIFKTFTKTEHVIDPIVPPFSWEWYVSFDHGYNNPTAIMFHAVSPDDTAITFGEHYASEMTVDDHSKVYHAMVKRFGKEPDFVVGDPAMKQRQGVTGTSIMQEYAERGIYIAPASNDVDSGINRMIQYLKVRGNGTPSWQITSDCENLINEMSKLRWATYSSRKMQYQQNKQEKIHKKDDHACDSTRYFFSFMPDLTPSQTEAESLSEQIKKHADTLGAVKGVAPGSSEWDLNLHQKPPEQEEGPDGWFVNYTISD